MPEIIKKFRQTKRLWFSKVRSILSDWGHGFREYWSDLDRPIKLLLVVLLLLIVIGLVERTFVLIGLSQVSSLAKSSPVFGPIFFPIGEQIEWKDRLQGLLLIIGLPIAFFLWAWRDRNVRDQIDNQRKDINLKEFQEVQLRAVGTVNGDISDDAREQVQIAALHQMRGFLKGEYGDSFRRPAFELLLAGHAASMRRIDLMSKRKIPDGYSDDEISSFVSSQVKQLKGSLTVVEREILSIIESEFETIFNSGFPLSNKNFDLIEVNGVNIGLIPEYRTLRRKRKIDIGQTYFARDGKRNIYQSDYGVVTIRGSSFFGFSVINSIFKNAFFCECQFEGSDIYVQARGGSFLSCNFVGSKFRSSIENPYLMDCDLRGVEPDHSFNVSQSRIDGEVV